MGYKILDVKEAIKDNISDWIHREWYNNGHHPDAEAEALELVSEINAIVDKHFERIER
tara:strand:+ start:165 stop:338 length:174 start_codon:yes stop_codon:yes gene_type:complete